MDTPGILWPKIDDEKTGVILALIGSVRDDILPFEELSVHLINILKVKYPGLIQEKFDIDENKDAYMILEDYSRLRNLVKAGNELDIQRGAKMLTDDFRSCKLGFLTLDTIPE